MPVWFTGQSRADLSLRGIDHCRVSFFLVVHCFLVLFNVQVARAQQKDQVGFNVAFSILFGMAPLCSSFLIFLVSEKESKAKHVQMVRVSL